MKKSIYILSAALLIIAGCRNQEQRLQADVEIPVQVIDLVPKPIEEFISTTGTVYPKAVVELKSKIAAIYTLERNPRTGRQWQMGDRVQVGDVIARLEDREFLNSVKLDAQELNLELAESEWGKQQTLYEKGGVTLKELKSAESSYINARYSLDNARLQMEKTRITVTINGVIVDLPFYTQGTLLESGAVIVKIMDYQQMYLEVKMPEKYLGRINPGQETRITNYTIPDDTIRGEITQTSPAIDPESRTFKGFLTIDNSRMLLRPGMFVKADIVVSRKDTAIVIPKDIILSRQRGKTVYVVNQGLAMERIITTGLENNTEVEVVRGLNRDERIVSSGYETLSNRARVKVIR
jgi:RND family efflux transporter MFP subunit